MGDRGAACQEITLLHGQLYNTINERPIRTIVRDSHLYGPD